MDNEPLYNFPQLSEINRRIQRESKTPQAKELLRTIQSARLIPIIDPEKAFCEIKETVRKVTNLEGLAKVILIGGSTSSKGETTAVVAALREDLDRRDSKIKLIAFPDRGNQVVEDLHGILFLYPPQLDNAFKTDPARAQFIVNQGIEIRKRQKEYKLPIISTMYILFGENRNSSVLQETGISPILIYPGYRVDKIIEELEPFVSQGLVFLECGSGANFINLEPVARYIWERTGIPPIVSGGISKPQHIQELTAGIPYPLGFGSEMERTNSKNIRDVYQSRLMQYSH